MWWQASGLHRRVGWCVKVQFAVGFGQEPAFRSQRLNGSNLKLWHLFRKDLSILARKQHGLGSTEAPCCLYMLGCKGRSGLLAHSSRSLRTGSPGSALKGGELPSLEEARGFRNVCQDESERIRHRCAQHLFV